MLYKSIKALANGKCRIEAVLLFALIIIEMCSDLLDDKILVWLVLGAYLLEVGQQSIFVELPPVAFQLLQANDDCIIE